MSRERHPLEAAPIIEVELIDVAAHAIEIYGEETARAILPPGTPFREHDYRFHVRIGNAQCTFNHQATAEDIAAWLKREVIES